MLTTMLTCHKLEEANDVVSKLPSWGLEANSNTMNNILHLGCAAKDFALVCDTLRQMEDNEYAVSKRNLVNSLVFLATPQPADDCLSQTQLDMIDNILWHARGATSSKHSTNVRPLRAGLVPLWLVRDMVALNTEHHQQRWKALPDLLRILVETHGKSRMHS